jgi:hypothetical protein
LSLVSSSLSSLSSLSSSILVMYSPKLLVTTVFANSWCRRG